MKEIRAARPRDAKAALAPAETRAATPLWTVPRQPSDFGRRRVSGAETWNSTRLRYRTRPMFRSDLEHSLYSRMWIWRGSDASASAVLGRPEFEKGKGRSGLLCQVLYSRTLDLERVRRSLALSRAIRAARATPLDLDCGGRRARRPLTTRAAADNF